jgi:hypothetical protein
MPARSFDAVANAAAAQRRSNAARERRIASHVANEYRASYVGIIATQSTGTPHTNPHAGLVGAYSGKEIRCPIRKLPRLLSPPSFAQRSLRQKRTRGAEPAVAGQGQAVPMRARRVAARIAARRFMAARVVRFMAARAVM